VCLKNNDVAARTPKKLCVNPCASAALRLKSLCSLSIPMERIANRQHTEIGKKKMCRGNRRLGITDSISILLLHLNFM